MNKPPALDQPTANHVHQNGAPTVPASSTPRLAPVAVRGPSEQEVEICTPTTSSSLSAKDVKSQQDDEEKFITPGRIETGGNHLLQEQDSAGLTQRARVRREPTRLPSKRLPRAAQSIRMPPTFLIKFWELELDCLEPVPRLTVPAPAPTAGRPLKTRSQGRPNNNAATQIVASVPPWRGRRQDLQMPGSVSRSTLSCVHLGGLDCAFLALIAVMRPWRARIYYISPGSVPVAAVLGPWSST
jgi:hypothetical protein